MTEDQWLACPDPYRLRSFLLRRSRPSPRRFRLAEVACCRRVWGRLADDRGRQAITAAERFAEGADTLAVLERAWQAALEGVDAAYAAADAYDAAHQTERPARPHPYFAAADALAATAMAARPDPLGEGDVFGFAAHSTGDHVNEYAAQAALLRDLFGNPFRQVHLDPSLLTWNNGSIGRMAEAVYEDREMPSGQFKTERVARLVEALEQAGCRDEDVMGHLRQPDGVHVRGCWVVDLLLEKS